MLHFLESKQGKLLLGLLVGVVPWSLTALPTTAQAPTPPPTPPPTTPPNQATPPSAPEFVTVCAYDPNSGLPNPLGMRAFITASEVEGNSIFRYEQFPAPVTDTSNPGLTADLASERTLTLYNTPLAEARQLLADNTSYYTQLIGTPVLGDDEGFGPINETLSCQEVGDGDITNVPQPPATPPANPPATPPANPPATPPANPPATPPTNPPATPPATPPTNPPTSATPPGGEAASETATTFADLPDGNYRLVSANFPNRVVSDEELLEAGGVMFLFSKVGDSVTGDFSFIDGEGGSCITGTIEGNTVTGESYAYSEQVREGRFLILGENVEGNRYDGSVINLAGFSQINSGTRLPVESCQ